MDFLRIVRSTSVINAFSILLGIFLAAVYVARPVSLPVIKSENLMVITGMPKITKLTPTKSSGSAVLFDVSEKRIYCGVGIIQGANGCFYIEELLDAKSTVSVSYFLMSNRFGFDYPILYSIKQNGIEKVPSRLTNERLQISYKSAWKRYYMLLSIFGFSALFLFVTKSLNISSILNMESKK